MTTNKKTPSALLSLLPIIVLVLMLVATVRTYAATRYRVQAKLHCWPYQLFAC